MVWDISDLYQPPTDGFAGMARDSAIDRHFGVCVGDTSASPAGRKCQQLKRGLARTHRGGDSCASKCVTPKCHRTQIPPWVKTTLPDRSSRENPAPALRTRTYTRCAKRPAARNTAMRCWEDREGDVPGAVATPAPGVATTARSMPSRPAPAATSDERLAALPVRWPPWIFALRRPSPAASGRPAGPRGLALCRDGAARSHACCRDAGVGVDPGLLG